MTKLLQKINNFFPWPLWVFPAVIFFPAFVTEFGVQNDYGLLPQWKMYPECPYLCVSGRVLHAFLINLQSALTNQIGDLALTRLLSFFVMLVFAGFFYRLLNRRLKLDAFWAQLVVLRAMILPSSQIYIMWATQIFPGFFALLLAMLSYGAFHSAMRPAFAAGSGGRRIFFAGIAALLFLASAFIYSPNAMFVFVCAFGASLFNGKVARGWSLRDFLCGIFFYVPLSALYLGINLFLVFPHPPSWVGDYTIQSPIYQFSVTTDILSKAALLLKTFVVALSRGWHTIWGLCGIIIPGVLFSATAGIVAFSATRACERGEDRKIFFRNLALMVFSGFVAFLLTNAPVFLAKEVKSLVGYRVLFPAAMLLWLIQVYLLQRCENIFGRNGRGRIVRYVALAMIGCGVLIAAKDVSDMARNFHRELTFVREKVGPLNFQELSNITVITLTPEQGETLIERKLPSSMSYMITLAGLIQPVIDAEASRKGQPSVRAIDAIGPIVFADPYTYVLDMHDGRLGAEPGETFRTGKKILAKVKTSVPSGRRLEVLRETYGQFSFREKVGTARISSWLADLSGPGQNWVQIEFPAKNQRLREFTFAVYFSQIPKAAPVACRLQGSADGEKWEELSTAEVFRENNDPHFKVYRVNVPAAYAQYRFYLEPEVVLPVVGIARIHLLLCI